MDSRAMVCRVSWLIGSLWLASTVGMADAVVTELDEWISTVRIPLPDMTDGTDTIEKLELFGVKLPTHQLVEHHAPNSVKLNIKNIGISASIGKITHKITGNSFDAWKEWAGAGSKVTLESVEVSLTGTFQAEVSVVLEKKLISIKGCMATVKVTKFDGIQETSGGLATIDPTGFVKGQIEDQTSRKIEQAFKDRVCGADKLTKETQRAIDRLIRGKRSVREQAQPQQSPLLNAVEWRKTKLFQWLHKFSKHAGENRFSSDTILHPIFASGMSHCLLGNRTDVVCLAPTPKALADALTLRYDTTAPDGAGRHLTVRIEEMALRLKNFTVDHMEVPKLHRQHPHWLGFNTLIGPLSFTFVGDLVIESMNFGPDARVRKRVEIDFGIEHLEVESFFLYEVDEAEFRALTYMQRANPVCLDNIKKKRFQLETLKLDVKLQQFNLSLGKEASYGEELRVRSLQDVLNLLFVTAVNNNAPVINDFVQSVVRPGLEMTLNAKRGLHGLLARTGVTSWGEACPKPEPGDDTLMYCAGGLVAAACFLGLALKAGAPQPTADGARLFLKQSTDLHWRVVVPMLMLAAVSLLLMSNIESAATMRIYLLLEGEEPMAIKDLNKFSVLESISDLWHSGAKALAILIFVFSLVFPYVKLLVCWYILFVPMTDRARGLTAHVVDAVGKASLLDAFALMFIVVLASFEVHFKGGVGAAMYIELESGFQAFLGGTILCMVVGHLVLMLHHRAVKHEEDIEMTRFASHASTSLTDFKRRQCLDFLDWLFLSNKPIKVSEDGAGWSLGRAVYCYIVAFLMVGICLSIGSFMDFTILEVDGLFGWFLNYLHETNLNVNSEPVDDEFHKKKGNVLEFSLVTLGYSLGEKSAGKKPMWTRTLQGSYFLFTVVFAMLFHAVGIIQCIWILAMRKVGATKEQLLGLKLTGSTLFAWSAIDVFVFGGMVTVFEMNAGSFMDTPDFMRSLIGGLRERRFLDIPGDEDVIIALHPKICAGAGFICVGTFMFLCSGVLFMRFLQRLRFVPKKYDALIPVE